jgi:MGT family glycosyltransferase
MLQETGHLNPTYKLLRELAARGHEVRYFAIPDLAAKVEAQGFAVEPWFPELFPTGFADLERKTNAFGRRRIITKRFETIAERLLDGHGPAASLAARRPDLLLVDVNEPRMALLAEKLSIPAMLVNTSLPQTWEAGVPPIRSGRVYGGGALARFRANAEWAAFLGKRRLSAELANALGACPPYDLTRRWSPRFGVPSSRLDTGTAYMPQVRDQPELVLCPAAFDFPRQPSPSRHYVESVDLGRAEASFSSDFLNPERPFVFCSLGTQIYRPRETLRFLRLLVAAFAARPEWQLLLSIVRAPASEDLGAVPPNVRVVRGAPQLAVLRRAQLMITHAGLGSVKECILNGVPMLAVPLDIDQPGNAARVEYHGIGLRCDVARVTKDELVRDIDRLLAEPAFAARLGAMKTAFETVEHGTRGADVVESVLADAR